ncbi:electron transport complex subunit RsxG [Silanimonas sp.]|jgi:electron transport complex protein RnfG|uniref:electron transport complex subunit RsxG n=1 Tax=Silanimonas sp. TaxID=1929290 RepID=UPI0022C23DBC|nr:electron transport complex subunit RsxG [Silanimonas sp.]MCZ8166080.1 electron transport complex subunit RsxG [Silanimonas sp.]
MSLRLGNLGRGALTLAVVGALGLGGLLAMRALTAERIAEQQRASTLRALAVLLPKEYDNDPQTDRIEVVAPAWLGSEDALTVRRARNDGRVVALLLEAVAPDGYNGDIRLLVGVDAQGRVIGVRVVEHRETPGLGDPIEIARGPWITGFDGRSLRDPAADAWRVRRDGGAFDQLAGATITPRAVVGAVRRALQFVESHGEALAMAPVGETLAFRDLPPQEGPTQ